MYFILGKFIAVILLITFMVSPFVEMFRKAVLQAFDNHEPETVFGMCLLGVHAFFEEDEDELGVFAGIYMFYLVFALLISMLFVVLYPLLLVFILLIVIASSVQKEKRKKDADR